MIVCAACEKPAVKRHCDGRGNPGCTWLICDVCRVLYDWTNDRAVGRDGKPIAT